MTFRPQPARWFELVTTKPHLAAALGALALTGAVELESRVELHREALLPDLAELLKAYRSVARSYEGHWPAPRAIPPNGDPRALLEDDWRRVSEWRKDADSAIARIESLAREQVDLDGLLDALTRAGDEFPDPARLARAGPRVAATLVRLPPHAPFGEAVRGALTMRWEAAGGDLCPRRRPAGRGPQIRVPGAEPQGARDPAAGLASLFAFGSARGRRRTPR